MYFNSSMKKGILILKPMIEDNDEPGALVGIKKEIMEKYRKELRGIVLDLSAIDYITSRVIGAIVGSFRFVAEKQCAFMISGLGLRLAETLYIVNLNRAIPFRLTLEEALKDCHSMPGGDPETNKKMISRNPALEKIRQWWEKNKSPDAVKDSAKAPGVIEQKASCAPEPEAADLDHGTAALEDPRLDDWMKALEIFMEARRLCEGHALNFSANMNFKEFLSQLAEKLSGEDSRR